VELGQYPVSEHGSRSTRMSRLAHQSRRQVDGGVAKSTAPCRGDKGCHRALKRSGIHVEEDEVGCIRAGHDRTHRLRVLPRAVVSQLRQVDSLHAG
jgi:hypothetical protein